MLCLVFQLFIQTLLSLVLLLIKKNCFLKTENQKNAYLPNKCENWNIFYSTAPILNLSSLATQLDWLHFFKDKFESLTSIEVKCD